MRLNTKKFLRNILICVIAWLVVSYILNYSPGFKRDKFENITNLIVNDKDVTEDLKNGIYIAENGAVYLSLDDVKDLFDKNICYLKDENLIITTSITKIATFRLEDSKVIINGIEKTMSAQSFKNQNTIYIPISELKNVYNVDIEYIKDTDIVVIQKLNSGLIKADVSEETVIKYKPRLLSKSVGKAQKGEEVSCYYTTSKGWRLIRTENGTLGYVKANKLDNEYIVRQDYDNEIKTAEITTSLNDGTSLNLYTNEGNSKIVIKTLFNLKQNGILDINEELNEDDYTVWATISNQGLEQYTNEKIISYEGRAELIDTVINYTSKYKLKGINIDFNNITNSTDFCRFIIELTPRLRDLGLTTNVVLNNTFKEEKIVGIVDFIITKKEQ